MSERFNQAKILMTIMFMLTSCTDKKPTKHQMFVFGTLVEISIWHNNKTEINEAVDDISINFNQMHHHWHAWKPGRLNVINQKLRNGETIALDPAEAQFIKITIDLAQQSSHLFNPAIGELIHLWGFHSDEYPLLTPPPTTTQIKEQIAQNVTVDDLILDGTILSSSNPNMWLDFGGIAKGYAVDQAIEILANHNINNAIINAGGDIRSVGEKSGQPWRVAIQSPKDWSMLAEIPVNNSEAIFTSGNYQRYKEFDGKRYAHIIHPETGLPVEHVVSVTVIAKNGVLADAAATALVVAGDDWPKIANQLGIKQALIIDENNQCFTTKEMLIRLEQLNVKCEVIN